MFTTKLYDADNKLITTETLYKVEGFQVDQNGVAKDLDFHMLGSRIGHMVNGKKVAKVKMEAEFAVGWGTVKDKPQPNTFTLFHRSDKEPDENLINFLGKPKTYEVKYELDSTGGWFWVDDSGGKDGKPFKAEGVDNELSKG